MDVWRRSIAEAGGPKNKDPETLVTGKVVPIMVGKGTFSKPFVVNGVTRYLEHENLFKANQAAWNVLRKTKKEIEEGDPEIKETWAYSDEAHIRSRVQEVDSDIKNKPQQRSTALGRKVR